MENGSDSTESISSMSDIEAIEEEYELILSSSEEVIDEKPEYLPNHRSDNDGSPTVYVSSDSDIEDVKIEDEVEKTETVVPKKSASPLKDCKLRIARWSPNIKSISHVQHDDSLPEIKAENDHHVLVKEDEIKQEEELLLCENDESASYHNDLAKASFNEYPNLKIKDEFSFVSCCVKLEKIDLSHLSNQSTTEFPNSTPSTSADTPKGTRSSRTRASSNRSERTEVLRKNASKKKSAATSRSKKATKWTRTKQRSSSRLKPSTSDAPSGRMKESSSQKRTKNVNENVSQKRANSNTSTRTRRASAARSDNGVADPPQRPKCNKVRFMEAHGLMNRQELASKMKKKTNPNSSVKKKKVTFAEPTVEKDLAKEEEPEKERDPMEEYRKAIATYLLEIDKYKQELDSYHVCLCCDRKYHLEEHCKVHVRGHFPGMLTS